MGYNPRELRRKRGRGSGRVRMRHRYSRERGSFPLMGACNVDGMIMSACEVLDTQDEAFNTEQFMRWE